MGFQQKILSSKNKITLISGILIVIGFIAHFGFGNTQVFNIAFIIASIIGVAPIAIQALGALKVKVISIDVLVTIAVIGDRKSTRLNSSHVSNSYAVFLLKKEKLIRMKHK